MIKRIYVDVYLGSVKLRAREIKSSSDVKKTNMYTLEDASGSTVGLLGKDKKGYFVNLSLDKVLKYKIVQD